MATQIALLRGINVGGHKRVGMTDLRRLMQALGHTDICTHLQSGNVVYRSAGTPPRRAACELEDRLAVDLGLSVRVLVRTRDELAEVVAGNPLGDICSDPARLLVTFLSGQADPRLLSKLDPADFQPDVFRAASREIYAWYPGGVRATRLTNAFWERHLGVTATARNWNTVTALLALADR
jgi:uncharacterized protein (DUF1697 family)